MNPETGTTTQSEPIEEALANLREATEIYLEEFSLTVSDCAILATFQVADAMNDGTRCVPYLAPYIKGNMMKILKFTYWKDGDFF